MSKSSYTALFPSIGKSKKIKKALESIYNQELRPKEVIIIDQSEQGIYKKVKSIIEGSGICTRYIHSTEYKGLVLSKYIASRDLRNEYLLIGEDDIVFKSDYMRKVINIFNNESRRFAVCGSEIGNEKDLLSIQNRIKNYLYKVIFDKTIFADERRNLQGKVSNPKYSHTTDIVNGGSTVIKKEVFSKIDFKYWLNIHYMEDLFFSMQMKEIYGNESLSIVEAARFEHYQESIMQHNSNPIAISKILKEGYYLISNIKSRTSRITTYIKFTLYKLLLVTFHVLIKEKNLKKLCYVYQLFIKIMIKRDKLKSGKESKEIINYFTNNFKYIN